MKKTILMMLGLLLTVSPVFAANYKIDPDHTTVGFRIRHLAISTVPGRFTNFEGTFSFDPASIANSKAEAAIKVGSVNTEKTKRDDHLRSPDFFDAQKFPQMNFKTNKISPVSADEFDAIGDLTIKDITKPVTLRVKYEGAAKDPWGNERAGFSASTKINRKDFGLTWNKALETGGLLVGDDVDINLEVEGIKQG